MFLKKLADLPPRKRIGFLALLLGVIALFADDPYDNAATKVNLKSIALSSSKDLDKIDVMDIADWLIKGKMDYRILDLRSEEEYKKYNIPTSENVQIENLLDYNLLRNERILLYSENELIASQAWFILKAAEFKSVSILNGGLEKWKNNILFPFCTCDENPSPEQLHKHGKLSEISKFFGGALQTDVNIGDLPQMEMPDIKAPAKIILKQATGKRKREGC